MEIEISIEAAEIRSKKKAAKKQAITREQGGTLNAVPAIFFGIRTL